MCIELSQQKKRSLSIYCHPVSRYYRVIWKSVVSTQSTEGLKASMQGEGLTSGNHTKTVGSLLRLIPHAEVAQGGFPRSNLPAMGSRFKLWQWHWGGHEGTSTFKVLGMENALPCSHTALQVYPKKPCEPWANWRQQRCGNTVERYGTVLGLPSGLPSSGPKLRSH